jgi:hypothetical protein
MVSHAKYIHPLFYGSLKGNLGVAGESVILLDPRGKLEETFSWGLGESMNNHAES